MRPSPLQRDLSYYCECFRLLKVNIAHGRASPHKICMLLAVLDLARGGALTSNRIEYAPSLLERYATYFNAIRGEGDHANPYFPFFHLKGFLRGGTHSFWHLHAKPGREEIVDQMSGARSAGQITSNIEYASLDPALFELLQHPFAIDALSTELARTWFGRGLQELERIVASTQEISRYERLIRGPAVQATKVAELPPRYIRDPAFRRVVLESYDYRCTATGLRLVLPDGTAMVEAAHIHPFCETGDDDPRNGLALTPDMHWAMDRNLIAPDMDFRWRVGKALDSRIPDHRALTSLEGKALFLPREPHRYPKRDAIEWRLSLLQR